MQNGVILEHNDDGTLIIHKHCCDMLDTKTSEVNLSAFIY